MNEWRPCPKPVTKKPNRRKKNPHKQLEKHKGIKIPPKKVRSAISKKEYQKTLEHHGECCSECGDPKIEMHHVTYRSHGGSGNYRNLRPLCNFHHKLAHSSREYADKWRKKHKTLYGPRYFQDKYSLWKEGLIDSPEDEKFERWMKEHEKEDGSRNDQGE